MSAISRSILALGFTTVAACGATGHQAMNGSVIMKVSETQAHVCLLEGKAAVGTQVQLYRHTCKNQYETPGTTSSRTPYVCKKEAVAIGQIAQTMGGHYALVTFPQGTQYEEGYTVEPMLLGPAPGPRAPRRRRRGGCDGPGYR